MISFVKAAGRLIFHALEVLLPVAGGVLLAVGGNADGETSLFGHHLHKSALLITAGALALAVHGSLVLAGRFRLRRLERERPQLEQRASLGISVPFCLMRLELRGLSDRAGFHSNERVSLYRHEDDGFTLVARFSQRPAFDESFGRTVLPSESGVLGRAWNHGRAAETDLPSSGPEGTPPTRQWLRAQQKLGVDEATARALTMRSQAYVAIRIASIGGDVLGAIVFESTVPAADVQQGGAQVLLDLDQLAPIAKDSSRRLAELIRRSQIIPRDEVRDILASEREG